METAKLNDQRIKPYHNVDLTKDYEVYNFDNAEKETVITKALKVARDKVIVDTVAKGGTITSIRIILKDKQVSFRNIVEKKGEKEGTE